MDDENWDYYLARFEKLDDKKTILPFECYEITERFKIYRDKENAFKSVACISIEDSKFSVENIKKVEDLVRTFSSFYSMESNAALDFYVPWQIIRNKEKDRFGMLRSISEESNQIAFPEDWQHNLTIEARLNISKKLWAIYSNIKEGRLKNHITNALHYYYYAKKASRIEEKIINYTIAYEILYLESSGEMSYKLANRASYILHMITWDNRKWAFDLLREMYKIRSKIVHEGTSKKELHKVDLLRLEKMLKTSIKLFMMLSEEYETKNEIIEYIERGILTGKTKLIEMKEFHEYFQDDTPTKLFPFSGINQEQD